MQAIMRILLALVPIAERRGVSSDVVSVISTLAAFIREGADNNPKLEALATEIEALRDSGEDPTPERIGEIVDRIQSRSDRIQDVDLSGDEPTTQ